MLRVRRGVANNAGRRVLSSIPAKSPALRWPIEPAAQSGHPRSVTMDRRNQATVGLVGMLLRVASDEFGKQILIAILPQKLEQVRKSLAKQRDMCTHDLAGLRRFAAKDCHHDLFVFGDR